MSNHYKHADCDKAIIEERLDDACEDCRNHMFKPLTPPDQPEDAALREKVQIQVDAYTMLKGGDPSSKTLGAYIAIDNIMQLFHAHEQEKVQSLAIEELDEILDMATSNYNNTGNEDMRALANYCSNRIIQLREHPQPTQPPAADTTKQGEGESDE